MPDEVPAFYSKIVQKVCPSDSTIKNTSNIDCGSQRKKL